MSDTIFALSTAPGRAGIAVVRVSGPATRDCVATLTGAAMPVPRNAALRTIRRADGEVLDRGLVLWFPAPHSFTGEDVAEFHVHGGAAVVDAVLRALGRVLGSRLAAPGEFTRRAVENGKLDLTAAEGLADLIAAETEEQRRQALRQYDGALAELYDGWRAALIEQAAWVEAAIEFADEEVPEDVLARARVGLEVLGDAIARHLDDGGRGEIVREGVRIALIGAPNAGKSSLLNALARRDVAIVSDLPGTTRDIVEVRLDLGGYPVVVSDTAGLRESSDAVEQEGVRRAWKRAREADLVLLIRDASSDVSSDGSGAPLRELPNGPSLTVWNKCDLAARDAAFGEVCVSAKTGEGIDALVQELAARIRSVFDTPREAAVLTRARHRAALIEAHAALARAVAAPEPELMAEDIRLALRALGRITGRVDVEDLLDVIFRDFCIGK